MRLHWGARTDRGLVRTLNEDAVVAQPPVFLVADGMGGHAAGEVASALVAESFGRLAAEATTTGGTRSVPAESVLSTIDSVNGRILQHGRVNPGSAGLGTTVSGVVVVDNGGAAELLAFNIGDSRLYRARGGDMVQVSVDHSAAQELVDDGVLDPDAARLHPSRHVVTRALGSEPAPQPDLWFITPEAGDRYVLCTDGLSGEVPDAELAGAVRTADDPDALAQALVDLALRHGGRDNVSVVVLDVLEPADGPEEDTSPRDGTGTAVLEQVPEESTLPR